LVVGQRVVRLVAAHRLTTGADHVQHLHMGTAHTHAAGQLIVVVDGGEHRLARLVHVLGAGRCRIGVGQVAGHGVEAHGLRIHRRAGDTVDGIESHGQRPSMACFRPRNFMLIKVRLVWKSMLFLENAACSTLSSTLLPSCDGWVGTRYLRSALLAAKACCGSTRCISPAKSMSRARKPGVSSLARLAARISLRCMRSSSARECTPTTSSIRILIYRYP